MCVVAVIEDVEVPIIASAQIPVSDDTDVLLSYLAARLCFVSAIYTSHELTLIVIRNSDDAIL